jgi:hypothetical protein
MSIIEIVTVVGIIIGIVAGIVQVLDYLGERRKQKKEPANVDTSKAATQFTLRSEPIKNLPLNDVEKMLKEKNFFDGDFNKNGEGLQHEYELIQRKGEKLVIDHTTGLTWQQSGSEQDLSFNKAKQYVHDLNRRKFAGYANWRLPTVEETMSLLEPERRNGELHVDPVFDKKQDWLWTVDESAEGQAWGVSFYHKGCEIRPVGEEGGVRAVRSNHS